MAFEDLLYPLLTPYMKSPQWIKNSVGRMYARCSNALRRGPHYERFAREAALRDGDAVRMLAHQKLQATLKWALETVPAYQPYRHLLAGIARPRDVLQQLPLLSKVDIKRDLTSFVSDGVASKLRLKTFTGGSITTPMMFYLHKGLTRTREYGYIENFHQRAALPQEQMVLALRGRQVPSARKKDGPLWMVEPIKNELIFSSDHLRHEHMPAYVDALRKWQPRHIMAYPSTIYPLAQWLHANRLTDVTQRIQRIVLFSENVLDHHIDLLKQTFSCPILRHYGHSERVLMAATMPDDERYFFWPQYGHFELVDDAGRPITEPGVLGEIVGTSFDNQVMPFIRYRTGDMAMLSERPHPLLPGYPVVERIEGRQQDFIICNDNKLVSLSAISVGLANSGDLVSVEAMQYVQEKPGHVQIKLVTRTPLSDAAHRRIDQLIRANTEGGCSAEVVEVAEIPRTARGKQMVLVQHCSVERVAERAASSSGEAMLPPLQKCSFS